LAAVKERFIVLKANITLIVFVSSLHLSDWVRDVAWAPSTAMPFNIVASCGEDCCVYIWKQTEVRCSSMDSIHYLQYHVFIISAAGSGDFLLNCFLNDLESFCPLSSFHTPPMSLSGTVHFQIAF
jgi:WD40 repeat protein